MKGKIPPLEHAAIDRRPFGKHNRLRIVAHRLQRKGITPDDVALKDIFDGIPTFVLCSLLRKCRCIYDRRCQKPLAALQNIILQNINAVDGGHGENRVPLILQLTLAVPGFNNAQFSLQYFRQKIPRPAGRFKEPGFDPFRFLFHQIKLALTSRLPVKTSP